jgi:hypothetical protein
MSRYAPHKWLLVQVVSPTPHFRIFGVWSGSYPEGESWRLNSGVDGVVEREDHFEIVGSSGSVYEIGKKSYGSTARGHHIIDGVVKQHTGIFGDDTACILDEADALKILEDWTDA